MDIDAIQQGTGELALVADDGGLGAGTLLVRVGGEPTGAGIHGADQHEIGGKAERSLGAADRYQPILHGLSERFQTGVRKLRQLIQEKDAAVGQADLTGPWPLTASHQAGMADRVMRRAKGRCRTSGRSAGSMPLTE
jgi:hypothetical protein